MRLILSLGVLLIATRTNSLSQINSVLGNINCGGGQSTYFDSRNANSGSLTCTCSAKCLSPKCNYSSVKATRSAKWGRYGNGVLCIIPITGTVKGGTAARPGNPTTTAVFAEAGLSGGTVAPYSGQSSTQQMDCFDGLVLDKPVLDSICL